MTFELATLLMFLNVNLRLIFSTLPMLPSHVSSHAPTNNILVTYGALQVLYYIVLYCIVTEGQHRPAVLEVWLVDMLQDDVSNTLSVVESLFAIDKYTSSSESSAKQKLRTS